MWKTKLFIFILFASVLGLPQLVLALGQMSEPIVIEEAIRGNEYQDNLIII